MIRYDVVRGWAFDDVRYEYDDRDVMLYALAVGLGQDPTDPATLRFVHEKNLQVLPTFACIAGAPGAWWRDPRTGADAVRLLQGEQHLEVYRPIPPTGALLARNRVHSLTDKGPGKGAIGVVLRDLLDPASGELIARSTNVSVLRGDGGFSAADGRSDPPPPPLPAIPDVPPTATVSLESRAESALLYRLTGDRNPLHSDPDVARAAGFREPILHGLCTFAMACHAALRSLLDYDVARFARLAVRFTAPVYPGERLEFHFWNGFAPGEWRLRAVVPERGVTVLDNGVLQTRGSG
ncbi:MAG: MaoC/PaaZ C-terminal domain-containing protein [Steroidobacteraceae bacterium]